jgi:hypothetical protein
MRIGPFVFERVYSGWSICNRFFHMHGWHDNTLSGNPPGLFLGWRPMMVFSSYSRKYPPIVFRWKLHIFFGNGRLNWRLDR